MKKSFFLIVVFLLTLIIVGCGDDKDDKKEDKCTPIDEICGDEIDNDCDGETDEGFADLGVECAVGEGACEASGTYICNADGSDVECDAVAGEPSDEICGDEKDNDCDGETDEPIDAVEICGDEKDNDCDGETDEVCYDFIAAGNDYNCAIKANGTLWCWGLNADGQCGQQQGGVIQPTMVEIEDSLDAKWLKVTAGDRHTCALRGDNTVWCWGNNDYGQLGDLTSSSKSRPSIVGGKWKYITAGDRHTCGIKDDDTLWCWGYNSMGQVGNNTTEDSIVPIKIGTDKWKKVSLGGMHTCGIRDDNTLWCWGNNAAGQLGNQSTDSVSMPVQVGTDKWEEISAGNIHTCGIKLEDSLGISKLYCWGQAKYGRLGTGSSSDSAVSSPQPIGDASWGKIAVAYNHTCGMQVDNMIWCWGRNNDGQLGIDPEEGGECAEPAQLDTINFWLMVAGGRKHTCGIKESNTIWCWGSNEFRQLGFHAESTVFIPTQVIE